MNLFECIGGGNSELQETVLWTNSSPTSSFANQVVTLSDDINNYDYIKFYFRVSTSNGNSQNVIASVKDFKNLTDATTSNSFVSLSSPNEYTGSYRMVRRLNYVSATSVRINTSVRANGQGSDDTLIIPIAICGLKYGTPTTGNSLKDAYKNKVNEVGMITYSLSPYSSRCTLNDGQVAVDTTNNTVYVYADFTVASTQGTGDYYQILGIDSMPTSYLPQRTSTTRETQTLTTDPSSSVPTKSWFVWQSNSQIRISIHKGQGFTQGDRYIVYGSWMY